MRDVFHNCDLMTVEMAAMGKILAIELHADGTYTTALSMYQSYAMVVTTTAIYNASVYAMLIILQQDTHQECYQH